MGIYKKLIAVLLPLIVIPMFIVSVLVFVNAKASLEHQITYNLEAMAKLKAEIIETFFNEEKANAIVTSRRAFIIESLIKLSTLSNDLNNKTLLKVKRSLDSQTKILQSEYGYHDIALLDSAGILLYSLGATEELNRSLPELKTVPIAKMKEGVLTKIVFQRAPNGELEDSIMVTAPVHDVHDRFVGVIVLIVDIDKIFGTLSDNTGIGNSGESLIVELSSSNEITFLTPLLHHVLGSPMNKKLIMDSRIALPAQQAASGKTGSGMSIDYRGEDVLAAWRYMPSLGWGLICKVDSKEAFAPVFKLSIMIAIIFIVTLLLTIAVAFLVARSISIPIRRLRKGTEIVATGNLDFKIGSNESNEFGQLSKAFDEMTEKLKHVTASRNELNREVSERRNVERYLKESLMAKSAFTSMVSHELRTPLTALKESISIIADGIPGPLNDGQQRLLDLADGNINRLTRLINEVLDFQALESGKIHFFMENNDINDVAREVRETMTPLAEKQGLLLRLALDDNIPKILFDRDKIAQVIINLVNNSLKFTEKGGITISTGLSGDGVKVSVKDTGIGIKEEDLPRLFTQYEQLDRRVGSSGLGLAICLDIMKVHGGRIWAESKIGEGATFHFAIPIRKKDGV